jgi:RNA polymerase sigma factor (sigma-70 family)
MTMEHSVSRLIDDLCAGDSQAATELWRRYYPRLVHLARRNLEGATRCMADEEDVALSAFKSFCGAAAQHRFPDLADRHDLWRLLFRITIRKAVDVRRHESRQRRGGGRVLDEAALNLAADDSLARAGIEQITDANPTPQFATMLAEEFERRLSLLSPELQQLAIAKMEGYTNHELAAQLGCALRTVERRLKLIRRKWEDPG